MTVLLVILAIITGVYLGIRFNRWFRREFNGMYPDD